MILDEQSVRAVIAHELGHIKNNDVMHRDWCAGSAAVHTTMDASLIVQTFGVVLLSQCVAGDQSRLVFRGCEYGVWNL